MSQALANQLAAEELSSAQLAWQAKGELSLNQSQHQPKGLLPWWQGGTGQLGSADDTLLLGPQLFAAQFTTDSPWSATLHAQWHQHPTVDLGVTESWISFNPLPFAGYRFRARGGYFYPKFSMENTDTAWSSPYSSNFSVINSWFAEELRARGVEFSFIRPGRTFNSASSYQWVTGIFQGNDALGTIISWRGFASHPFQTNLGETVRFADYPSIRSGPLALQPDWVQPTREIDQRTGFYSGLHWSYQQKSEVRVYYYDNNGDPLVIKHGQYAWDTQFSSIAWQQELNEQLRFVSQYLTGSTEMGPQAVVVDFKSWFSLLHYDLGHSRLSIRYDYWQQQDKDLLPSDDNNGRGHGWNINLQYPLSENLSLALEWSHLNTEQASRGQWQNWPLQRNFQQLQLLMTWRFASAN